MDVPVLWKDTFRLTSMEVTNGFTSTSTSVPWVFLVGHQSLWLVFSQPPASKLCGQAKLSELHADAAQSRRLRRANPMDTRGAPGWQECKYMVVFDDVSLFGAEQVMVCLGSPTGDPTSDSFDSGRIYKCGPGIEDGPDEIWLGLDLSLT